LFIGYRDNDTFTVAFYAGDVNIDVPAGYRYTDIKGNWINLRIYHDTTTRKTQVWIGGEKMGEGVHSRQYESNLNLIGGARNTSYSGFIMSNLRIITSPQNTALNNVTDEAIKGIFENELKELQRVG